MLSPSEIGGWAGLANGLGVFTLACIRARRFETADAGLAGVAFLASYNVYPPVVLFLFATTESSYKTLPSALNGYEKYMAAAAFLSFLFTIAGIVACYAKAWKLAN